MIGRISSLTVGMAVFLGASAALAQGAPAPVPVAELGSSFATAGTLVLGAERMFGYSHTIFKSETDVPPAAGGGTETDTLTTDTFSILGRAPVNPFVQLVSPYSVPRIGIDFFPIDGLSVGGSLTFVTTSGEQESEQTGQPTTNRDTDPGNGFLIAPRVGYGMMFNDFVGFWPRGGITFFTASSDNLDASGTTTSERTINGFALTVEVPFILSPADHVGITIGPTLDFPLSGKLEVDPVDPADPTTETDLKITEIGLNAGLIAWF